MGKYTDKQNLEIAMKQYPPEGTDYTIGQLISINNGDETIKVGYVAEVIHKPSGEDTYILTDKPLPENPTPRQLAEVTEVTMLYQGSTLDKDNFWHDLLTDWIITDGSIAISELTHNPLLFHPNPKKTPQQIDDASNTLNVSMDKYQNAKFRLYGHSLSCTSVQVAVCRCKDPDRILEVNAYNGPNASTFLTPEERMQGEKLKPKIHIFIDIKDIVGLGYKAWTSIGQVVVVKRIFNTLAIPSTLLLDQFDKDTKSYITSYYDYKYLPGNYNRRLKHLSDAAAKLEENCSFERDTEASSIFKFQPTIVNSWKVVEKGYNKLLELSEQIFEGDGLRTGREDAIQQSIKDVLDVEETNIKELQNVISNLKTFMTVTTLSFDDKDSSLGNALQAGTNFSVGASVSGVPQSYEAYLSRSEIFDDVKDVLQAFDIQVEKTVKSILRWLQKPIVKLWGILKKAWNYGLIWQMILKKKLNIYSTLLTEM